jgi:hypothetical protein
MNKEGEEWRFDSIQLIFRSLVLGTFLNKFDIYAQKVQHTMFSENQIDPKLLSSCRLQHELNQNLEGAMIL